MIASILNPHQRDSEGNMHTNINLMTNGADVSAPNSNLLKQSQYHVIEVDNVVSLFDETSESETEREVKKIEPIKDISLPQINSSIDSSYNGRDSRRNSTIPKMTTKIIAVSANDSTQRSRSQSASREGRSMMSRNSRSSSTNRATRPRIDTTVSSNGYTHANLTSPIKSLSNTTSPIDPKALSPVERKARSPLSGRVQGSQIFPTTTKRTERGVSPQEPRKVFQYPLNNLSSMVEHVNSPTVTVLSPVNEAFDKDVSRLITTDHKNHAPDIHSALNGNPTFTSSERNGLSPSDTDRSYSSKFESSASFRPTPRVGLGLNTTSLMRSSSCTNVYNQKDANQTTHQESYNTKPSAVNTRRMPGHRRTTSDQESVTSPQSVQNLIWSPESNISSESDPTDSPDLLRQLSRLAETKIAKRRSLITNNNGATNSIVSTPISATGTSGIYAEIKDDYRYVAREISHSAMIDRERKKTTSLVGRARSATRGLGISSSADKENLPRARNASFEVQRSARVDSEDELWW